MYSSINGVFYNGSVNILENIKIPEGSKLIITIIDDNEKEFWVSASNENLKDIWNNPQDDIYEELLKK